QRTVLFGSALLLSRIPVTARPFRDGINIGPHWGQNPLCMLKNYFKVAVRNLVRTKIFSLINIFGLSLGVACCLLLSLYVRDEFSYDRHHERLSDLYRIDTQFEGVVGFDKLGSVSPPITMTLKEELPEVEEAARVVASFSSPDLIQYEDE